MASHVKEDDLKDLKESRGELFHNIVPKGKKIIGMFVSINLGAASIICILFPSIFLIRYSIHMPHILPYIIMTVVFAALMVIPSLLFIFLIIRPIRNNDKINPSALWGVSLSIIVPFIPSLFQSSTLLISFPYGITFLISSYLVFLGITVGIVLIMNKRFKSRNMKENLNNTVKTGGEAN